MAEAYVENGLEFLGHLAGKHFDPWYDRVVGKPRSLPQKDDKNDKSKNGEQKQRPKSESYTTNERAGLRYSSADNAYVYTTESPYTSRAPSQRRKQLSILPPPEADVDIGRGQPLTEKSLKRHEQILPPQKDLLLEKGLPPADEALELVYRSKSKSRRDSAMASGYHDDYRETRYNDRPRSQPPRGRYYDDESDYDERTGDRHRGGGRGWDDRDDDFDTVRETREVYRGPAANRPWGPERNESGRSDYTSNYPSGAVAQYRRSEGTLAPSQYTERSKSRGRAYSRSRSRSSSRSSRSRSSSRGGIRGALENTFSTSKGGIAAGLVGAVVGGLAGRHIGHQRRTRDVVIGATVGGLAANAGQNALSRRRENREEEEQAQRGGRYEKQIEGPNGRYEKQVDYRYDDRARSNVR